MFTCEIRNRSSNGKGPLAHRCHASTIDDFKSGLQFKAAQLSVSSIWQFLFTVYS